LANTTSSPPKPKYESWVGRTVTAKSYSDSGEVCARTIVMLDRGERIQFAAQATGAGGRVGNEIDPSVKDWESSNFMATTSFWGFLITQF
jgi:hypothetical protein